MASASGIWSLKYPKRSHRDPSVIKSFRASGKIAFKSLCIHIKKELDTVSSFFIFSRKYFGNNLGSDLTFPGKNVQDVD